LFSFLKIQIFSFFGSRCHNVVTKLLSKQPLIYRTLCLSFSNTPAQNAATKYRLDRNAHMHFPANNPPASELNYARRNTARGLKIQRW